MQTIGLAIGVTIGGAAAKSGKNTHLYNVCEAIEENWSTQLDKLESIHKKKFLGTTYENYIHLMQNFLCYIRTSWGGDFYALEYFRIFMTTLGGGLGVSLTCGLEIPYLV